MNKKAEMEITTVWLVDIILLLVLLFMVFNPALTAQQENENFYKRFSAKNIALLIDTIYTSPYPIKMFYDERTLSFSYFFDENTVYVLDETQSKESKDKIGYHFIEDKNKEFIYKQIDPKFSVDKNTVQKDDDEKELLYIPLAFISNSIKVEPLSAIPTNDLLSNLDEPNANDDGNDEEIPIKEDENGCSIIPNRDVKCLLDPNPDYFTDHPNKDCVVLHYTAMAIEAQETNDGMIRYQDKSVQYIVGRDGEIVQEVLDKYGAYHTGCFDGCSDQNCCTQNCPVCDEFNEFINPNKRCIGIEIANLGNNCADTSENFLDIPCVTLEGETVEEYSIPQIDAVVDLVKYLAVKHDIPLDRKHIVSHQEIAIGKPDPGPAFDWDSFMKKVKE